MTIYRMPCIDHSDIQSPVIRLKRSSPQETWSCGASAHAPWRSGGRVRPASPVCCCRWTAGCLPPPEVTSARVTCSRFARRCTCPAASRCASHPCPAHKMGSCLKILWDKSDLSFGGKYKSFITYYVVSLIVNIVNIAYTISYKLQDLSQVRLINNH